MPYGKYRSGTTAARRASTAVVQKRARKVKVDNLRLNPTVRALVDRRIAKKNPVKEKILIDNQIYAKRGQIQLGDFKYLLPTFPIGDDRDDREGNKIRLKSIQVKGFVRFENQDDDSMKIFRVMVVSGKKDITANLTWADEFLLINKDATSYNGDLVRQWYPINYNKLTVHYDRSHQVVMGKIVDTSSVLPSDDTKVVIKPYLKQFTINLKCKNKILRFADDSDTVPSNWRPYLVMGFVNPRQTGEDQENDLNYFYTTRVRWVNA